MKRVPFHMNLPRTITGIKYSVRVVFSQLAIIHHLALNFRFRNWIISLIRGARINLNCFMPWKKGCRQKLYIHGVIGTGYSVPAVNRCLKAVETQAEFQALRPQFDKTRYAPLVTLPRAIPVSTSTSGSPALPSNLPKVDFNSFWLMLEMLPTQLFRLHSQFLHE